MRAGAGVRPLLLLFGLRPTAAHLNELLYYYTVTVVYRYRYREKLKYLEKQDYQD